MHHVTTNVFNGALLQALPDRCRSIYSDDSRLAQSHFETRLDSGIQAKLFLQENSYLYLSSPGNHNARFVESSL